MTSQTRTVELLSKKIRPLLAGMTPEVQGAMLADLVSVFIAGHHPELREAILRMHVDLVRDLIPHTEKEIFPHGRPTDWPKGENE